MVGQAGFGSEQSQCVVNAMTKEEKLSAYMQIQVEKQLRRLPSLDTIREDGSLPWGTDEEKTISDDAGRAAKELLGSPNFLSRLKPEDREKAERFARAFDATVEGLYTGHNRLLREIHLREKLNQSAESAPKEGSIDFIITSRRFAVGFPWWQDSLSVASIGPRSRSFLKVLSPGENVSRKIFWLVHPRAKKPGVLLDEVRVAENLGGKGSIELFIKDRQGAWQPFLYEKVVAPDHSSRLYPVQTLTLRNTTKPVKAICAGCHETKGVFSPRPIQMKTAEDFRIEGYHDETIIRALMDPRNQ